jgi:hypothetical protein
MTAPRDSQHMWFYFSSHVSRASILPCHPSLVQRQFSISCQVVTIPCLIFQCTVCSGCIVVCLSCMLSRSQNLDMVKKPRQGCPTICPGSKLWMMREQRVVSAFEKLGWMGVVHSTVGGKLASSEGAQSGVAGNAFESVPAMIVLAAVMAHL